jgi:hypothetical protein
VAILLIVIIVGGVILIKTYKRQEPPVPVKSDKVAVEDILPNKEPLKPNAPKPRVTSTPDPSVAEVIASNSQNGDSARLQPGQVITTPAPTAPVQPAAVLPAAQIPPTANLAPAAEAKPIPADTASVAGDVRAAIERSVLLRGQGKIVASRDLLNSVLMSHESQVRAMVKEQLNKLADTWLMSKEVMADDTLCSYYMVQPAISFR